MYYNTKIKLPCNYLIYDKSPMIHRQVVHV